MFRGEAVALENCPSCKKRISTKAVSCPKCGHPLSSGWAEARRKKRGRIYVIVAGILGTLFLAPGAAGLLAFGHPMLALGAGAVIGSVSIVALVRPLNVPVFRSRLITLGALYFSAYAVFGGWEMFKGESEANTSPSLSMEMPAKKPPETAANSDAIKGDPQLSSAPRSSERRGTISVTPSTKSLRRMISPVSVEQCPEKRVISDWHSQCKRIFSYTIIPPTWDDEHPTRLTLVYDGERVSIVALVPDWYHRKFYTNEMPVIAIIDGEKYVPNRSWFVESRPPKVSVGQDIFDDFEWKQDAQWVASVEASEKLIDAFRKGVSAEVAFTADGKKTAIISLSGFSAALDAATVVTKSSATASVTPQTDTQAVNEVERHLTKNVFGVTRSSLKPVKNPKGQGYFVYVPETRFPGIEYERKFIWFVGNGATLRLNGATSILTPDLPWPRDVDWKVFEGAGVDQSNITEFGLSLAF